MSPTILHNFIKFTLWLIKEIHKGEKYICYQLTMIYNNVKFTKIGLFNERKNI